MTKAELLRELKNPSIPIDAEIRVLGDYSSFTLPIDKVVYDSSDNTTTIWTK